MNPVSPSHRGLGTVSGVITRFAEDLVAEGHPASREDDRLSLSLSFVFQRERKCKKESSFPPHFGLRVKGRWKKIRAAVFLFRAARRFCGFVRRMSGGPMR